MSEDVLLSEDQSHYEISLTAGQAFVAFVLLLLSLAASFAFGLVIGKGQMDDRLFAKKESTVVNEAAAASPKKSPARLTDMAVAAEDFKQPAITEESGAPPTPAASAPAAPPAAAEGGGPTYAQLLSSSDQSAAEAMAAKLIDAGFNTAYVERSTNAKGPMFRVRVKFPSEAEARAAETKLKEFSKEVWITR